MFVTPQLRSGERRQDARLRLLPDGAADRVRRRQDRSGAAAIADRSGGRLTVNGACHRM